MSARAKAMPADSDSRLGPRALPPVLVVPDAIPNPSRGLLSRAGELLLVLVCLPLGVLVAVVLLGAE